MNFKRIRKASFYSQLGRSDKQKYTLCPNYSKISKASNTLAYSKVRNYPAECKVVAFLVILLQVEYGPPVTFEMSTHKNLSLKIHSALMMLWLLTERACPQLLS